MAVVTVRAAVSVLRVRPTVSDCGEGDGGRGCGELVRAAVTVVRVRVTDCGRE